MPTPLTDCRTARLHFRALNVAEHAKALHDMDNDPEVMRYINEGPKVAWDGYVEWFAEWLTIVAKYGIEMGFWAAHRNDDGSFLGWFHLRPSTRFDQRLELGYRFRRAAWGQGLATEGSKALIAYGFERLAAPEVIAITLERNVPSRRVMEKVGMQFERAFVFPPDVCAAWNEEQRRGVLYAITRPT